MPLPTPLRALRHPDYRRFFLGQSVSLVGTWVTRIAVSWLVWRLTRSPWWLGAVNFAGLVPLLVLSPFAGVLVDRWDRHRAMVVTQLLSLLQSAALAWLAFSGHATVGWLLALQAVQGIINAVDTPTRQALVVELVADRADLPNAIALNSSMFNGSRLVGPAIGGALIAWVGEAWCFVIDAVSYVAVVASLAGMRHSAGARPPGALTLATFRAQFREGLRYAFGTRAVRSILLLVAAVQLLGVPYSVLLPDLAARALGGGPDTLGLLMTAAGAGALLAAAFLATRTSLASYRRVMLTGTVGFGGALLAFAWVTGALRSVPLAAAVLLVAGAMLLVTTSAANALLQSLLPDELRGRVMALYTTAFLGTAPVGSLAAGAVANRIGTEATLVGCAAGCLVLGAWFAGELRPAPRGTA